LQLATVMNANLKRLIDSKREWSEPLSTEDVERGFKGWYSSKYLPHFDAPGTRQYVTYRLADSLPAARRHEWEALRNVDDKLEQQRRIELYVDRGYGACHLRGPRVATMLQDNFWHQDGKRYRLLAWVVMPNHIHALVELWRVPLGKVVQGWKSYTTKEANRILGREGAFWEADYFDRYIRDEAHFWRVVRYIENNPVKARLAKTPEEWLWSSARYRSRADLSACTLTHPGADRVPPPV
jgi:putative transposase